MTYETAASLYIDQINSGAGIIKGAKWPDFCRSGGKRCRSAVIWSVNYFTPSTVTSSNATLETLNFP